MVDDSPVRWRRRFIDTNAGSVHYASAGKGYPVVLLHQTPRSWREYEWVIPYMIDDFLCLAVDIPGFGDSDPPDDWTIESITDGVISWINELRLEKFAIVGHHTGGVVGYDIASRLQDVVTHLVLSGVPYVEGPNYAGKEPTPSSLDDASPAQDGSHLLRLWEERAKYCPIQGRTELLQRATADVLRASDPARGHSAVANYNMANRFVSSNTKTLYLIGDQDPSWNDRYSLVNVIPNCDILEMKGTGVAYPEQFPQHLAEMLKGFIS